MKDNDFLKELIARASKAHKGYFHYAHLVVVLLDKHLHESLAQLIGGPVWDGDVISKSCRDELIDLGLALRVCCNGQQGYTGATYLAYSVMKIVEQIKAGEIAE